MALGAEKSLEVAILRLAIIICGYMASYAQGTIVAVDNQIFYYIATAAVIIPSVCAMLPMCTPKRLFKVTAVVNLLVTCWAAALAFPDPNISYQTSWFIICATAGICFIFVVIWKFAGRAVSLISIVACVVTVGSTYQLWFDSASLCTQLAANKGILDGLKECGIDIRRGFWNAAATAMVIIGPLSVILTFTLVIMKRTCKMFCSQLRMFQGMGANFAILASVNIGMYSVSVSHFLNAAKESEILNALVANEGNKTDVAELFGIPQNASIFNEIIVSDEQRKKIQQVLNAVSPLISALAMTFLCLSLLFATHAKTSARPRSLSSKAKRPPKIARLRTREMEKKMRSREMTMV